MRHDIRRAIAVLLGLMSLAACASMEELRARDEGTCYRKGLQPGTADFISCVQEQQMLRSSFLMVPGRF